jgi:YbbR domain-containing protein
MWVDRLPNVVTRNVGLRTIAVGLAIGLWLFVNAGQHEAQISLDVPVSYRGLPQDITIVGQRPDFVQLQISGPRTLLSLLDPGRLELRLNLAEVNPGQVSFRLNPEMFNVPRQTNVTQISPSQIVLDVDRIAVREIPVHLDIVGPVEKGFTIGSVELTPSEIGVRGPAREVSRLQRIDTEPFDVKGLSGEINRVVPLTMAPDPVKFSANEIEARVRLDEVLGEREFRTVEVKVRSPDLKYRVYTRDVNVTVHGPVRRLSSLSLAGMVYVDAEGEQPGTYELPVQIDLPDGFQMVRATPGKVRLRILNLKAGIKS